MKKFLKTFFGITACLSLLVIAVPAPASGPEDALKLFLDASLAGKPLDAYQHISSTDRKVYGFDEYLGNRSGDIGIFLEIVGSMTSYNIEELEVDGDIAKANVKVGVPDLPAMLTDLAGKTLAAALFSEDVDRMARKWLIEKIRGEDVPRITVMRPMTLIREQGEWRVYLGWSKDKATTDQTELLQDLLKTIREIGTTAP